MGASHQIVDLRQLLAERYPTRRLSAQKRLETGLATLDAATEGGLPQGAITELASPNPSAGSALILYQLLDAAAVGRYFLALIDGRDSFDPCAFRGLGAQRLRHLLWLRCGHALEAIKAADLLLRDGNFPLVVLDLVLNSAQELRKIPATSWYRLQRLVEAAPTAFLVLTRRSIVSSAQWKLELGNTWQLSDLEQSNQPTRLQIQVQRVQGSRSEMAASA